MSPRTAFRSAFREDATLQKPLPTALPSGFRCSDDGGIEYLNESRSEEEPDWRRLCSYLQVAAVTRDKSGNDWGRLIEVKEALAADISPAEAGPSPPKLTSMPF